MTPSQWAQGEICSTRPSSKLMASEAHRADSPVDLCVYATAILPPAYKPPRSTTSRAQRN